MHRDPQSPAASAVATLPPAAGSARSRPLVSLRLLALLCVLLPMLAYAIVGVYLYRQLHSETEVRLDRALRIAQEHALKVLDTNETVIARVLDTLGDADAASLRSREPALRRQLAAMARNRPQIQSIRVEDADGRLLASDRGGTAGADLAPLAARDRACLQAQRPGDARLCLSNPGVDGGGAVLFDMRRARYGPDGRLDAIVSISLPPAYFDRFYSALAADEPGLAITMLHEDGAILTRWPNLRNAPPRLAAGSPVMQRIAAGETRGTTRGVSSVDGRERLLNFAKVDGFPVFVGTGMDLSEITHRWLNAMLWLGAFGVPPLLGLFFAARSALRRTGEALDAADRLETETQTRRRAEEALVQAQKMEALGRLTGGVAHDFNNALMVVSSSLFLLLRKHPEVVGPQVASIQRAVDAATRLTRQLLAFSRRQPLVPQQIRLQDRLPACEALLEPVLGSQIALAIEVDPQTRPVVVDAGEFELALLNLAINARDAMQAGGTVSVKARNAEPDLPLADERAMVVIEVTDSGAGIPPDILDKVFEPFFTTKPMGKGTGLGLSQIYGMCQRAGGHAGITSRLGVGTTVRMVLPAAPGDAVEAAEPRAGVDGELARSVLLVEDNDDVAESLEQVLRSIGCEVERVDRAAAALAWLETRPQRPDVLLTDVVMPGEMDGAALAEHVRVAFPGMKIVVMTGYAKQAESIAAKGFEIIPKPCSPALLAATIGRRPSPA